MRPNPWSIALPYAQGRCATVAMSNVTESQPRNLRSRHLPPPPPPRKAGKRGTRIHGAALSSSLQKRLSAATPMRPDAVLRLVRGQLVPEHKVEGLATRELTGLRPFRAAEALQAQAYRLSPSQLGPEGALPLPLPLPPLAMQRRTGRQHHLHLVAGVARQNRDSTAEAALVYIHRSGGRLFRLDAPLRGPFKGGEPQQVAVLALQLPEPRGFDNTGIPQGDDTGIPQGDDTGIPQGDDGRFDDADMGCQGERAGIVIAYGLHKCDGRPYSPEDASAFCGAYHAIRGIVDSPWHLNADRDRIPGSDWADVAEYAHMSAQFGWTRYCDPRPPWVVEEAKRSPHPQVAEFEEQLLRPMVADAYRLATELRPELAKKTRDKLVACTPDDPDKYAYAPGTSATKVTVAIGNVSVRWCWGFPSLVTAVATPLPPTPPPLP